MLLTRTGFGDDFERDNFDYVQAATYAAPPPPAIVRTSPSFLTSSSAAAAFAPAAPAVSPWASLVKKAAATVGAVASVVVAPPPASKSDYGAGANPFALTPTQIAVRGDAPASAIGPATPPVVLTSSGPDPADLVRQAERTRWTTLAIAGAAGVGLILLLRR